MDSIHRLAGAGADLIALSANTPHIVFDELAARSPVPMPSIVEACADEAARRRLRRLSLLGPRFTMEGPFYPAPGRTDPETDMHRIRQHDLPFVGSCFQFVGSDQGDAPVSAFLLRAEPGRGPGAHRHPHDEVQFVLEGRGRYGVDRRFVVGTYRRRMRAIGQLGALDRLFGVPATTRSWHTMVAIAELP